ncbi:MAG: [protein-PII] uridylyltransferase [Pseudomonadota bacterium]
MSPVEPQLVEAPFRSNRLPRPWRIEDIVDGRKLRVQLTAAALAGAGRENEVRARALDLLHTALFRGRMIAQERLQAGADGLDTARLLSAVQDAVMSALYDFTTTHVFRARNPTEGERLSVLAVGGYGRHVLAPSSDIDLLFLRQYKVSPWAESVIEYMLYALWDMGLKVGHSFRTIDTCISLAKSDVTIKSSLLDARYLFGDVDLFSNLQARFRAECVEGHDAQFIADKLGERDQRHARQGNSPYVVEPNVKEGKGGLRDMQTMFWIAKHMQGGETLEEVMRQRLFTDQEYVVFIRAARFLWTIRCHLHYLTGRAEERLSFDLQPEIAARLNYRDRGDQLGVERLMKRYFLAAKDVGNLTRILGAKLDDDHNGGPKGLRRLWPQPSAKPVGDTGFEIGKNRIGITDSRQLRSKPVDMLRLFAIAAQSDLELHPNAMADVARSVRAFRPDMRADEDARDLFFDCLLKTEHPGKILRSMNETGLLGRFLPEFGGIVAQTQFNMYHHYTVDEHTLRAIETMSDIEHGRSNTHPHPTRLFKMITARRALYLAMLLHDTGKGRGDQQIAGMETAEAACRRLGLPDDEVELVAWLVGHHLEMSETAQKRDISDPRTVATFAEMVGSLERLSLLHILTAADISAVGPKVWNGWKGQLLSDLHHNTVAALRGGRSDEALVAAELEERAEKRRGELASMVGELPPVMAGMETAYWTGFPAETLAQHARALSEQSAITVEARLRGDQSAVSLLVSGDDRIGLFADLAGTIAGEGANIVAAQVFTSESGQIVDVFTLHGPDGGPFADGDAGRLGGLETAVTAALEGNAPPPSMPKKARNPRAAAFLVRPVVSVDAQASRDFTVIDIAARDRPGLLYDIARCLAECDLSIHSAHVGSYGERVFDAFYVKTLDGTKLTDAAKKETLKARLLDVLSRNEPARPKTPARELARARPADSF